MGSGAFSLLLGFAKQLGSGVFFAENDHGGCGVGHTRRENDLFECLRELAFGHFDEIPAAYVFTPPLRWSHTDHI